MGRAVGRTALSVLKGGDADVKGVEDGALSPQAEEKEVDVVVSDGNAGTRRHPFVLIRYRALPVSMRTI